MAKTYLNGRLEVKTGDITKEQSDAIVNAANSSLMGGGGVDGAIHRAGGASIKDECVAIRKNLPDGLPTGEAIITGGGMLPAKYVIHTVGPIWKGGNLSEAEQLASCYKNCLRLALKENLKTVVFPAISTGVYGYPLEEASKVASTTIKTILQENDSLERITLIFFQQRDMDIFLSHAQLD